MRCKPGIAILLTLFFFAVIAGAEASGRIETVAKQCHREVTAVLNELLSKGTLSEAQLFDTFYIPIPGSNPKKFHTQYDRYADTLLQPVLDKYLTGKIIYVIAVDVNGYAPTHNRRFARSETGTGALDVAASRAKRIFNDRTGLAAARNKKPVFNQTYQRDTGETIYDCSMPIMVRDRHWGALRIGYRK